MLVATHKINVDGGKIIELYEPVTGMWLQYISLYPETRLLFPHNIEVHCVFDVNMTKTNDRTK